MSKADIKILNDYLDETDRKFVSLKRLKFLQAIENLISKYKEQEKIIELMNDDLRCHTFWGCRNEDIQEYYKNKVKELKDNE